MADTGIIDSERVGTWTAGAFVLALLALVVAVAAIYRTNAVLYGTQIEVLALNKKISTMSQQNAATPAAPAPSTPVPVPN